MNKPAQRIHPSRSRASKAKNDERSRSKSSRDRGERSGSFCQAVPTVEVSTKPELDSSEFEAMVWPLRGELFATALRYTKNAAAAEDLVSETLMRALAAWASFQKGSNCRAWLYRILTNSFINIHRKRKRFRSFAHERGDDGVIAFYGVQKRRDPRPDERVIDNALSDEVSAAMAELTDDYRQVVELADIEGIRYKEIAERIGVPIGTVMSRLFRARRQLEAALAEYAELNYNIARRAA